MSTSLSAINTTRFFFAFVSLSVLAYIIHLNDYRFIYSLDDPYIHLALAENIIQGHYGVNLSEYSSPASSIIWPFLLAILQPIDPYGYSPLIINLICAYATFHIVTTWIFKYFSTRSYHAIIISLIIVFSTNIIGLIFTGMEHNLQVLLSLLALNYAVKMREGFGHSNWFTIILVLGPLVRYENLALSLTLGLYSYMLGNKKSTLVAFAAIGLSMIGFGYFLLTLELNPIPSSLQAKSEVISQTTKVPGLIANIGINLITPGGLTFLIILFFLLKTLFSQERAQEEKKLTFFIVMAGLLHFIAGKFSWLGRYEIYIYLPCLLWAVSVYHQRISQLIRKPQRHPGLVLFVAIFLLPYSYYLIITPGSSHDIYSQQYQMHRFVVDHYKKPIAVNDLGWVSYQNDQYVLDLWGLASDEALQMRTGQHDSPIWMDELVKIHNVDLAMIYVTPNFFNHVPDNWILLGKLVNRNPSTSIIGSSVSFYATNRNSVDMIQTSLAPFIANLPQTAEFVTSSVK